MVQIAVGTKLMPVCSRLKIKSVGISSSETVSNMFARNDYLTSTRSSDGRLHFVVALLFIEFICFNNGFAQGMVNVAGPPCHASLVQSIASTKPFATAIKI